MTRRFAPLLPVVLAACASGGAAGPASRTTNVLDEVERAGGVATLQTTVETAVSSDEVAAPADRVYEAVLATYQELGIPANALNQNTRVAAISNARVRRVGGKRMSTFIHCGGNYMDNADAGEVQLSVRSQVVPSASGSTVRTEVQATAKAGMGTDRMRCTSTGELESLIAQKVRERVGTAAR